MPERRQTLKRMVLMVTNQAFAEASAASAIWDVVSDLMMIISRVISSWERVNRGTMIVPLLLSVCKADKVKRGTTQLVL